MDRVGGREEEEEEENIGLVFSEWWTRQKPVMRTNTIQVEITSDKEESYHTSKSVSETKTQTETETEPELEPEPLIENPFKHICNSLTQGKKEIKKSHTNEEEEKRFSLISVNFEACEEILKSTKTKRNKVNVALHGKIKEDTSGNGEKETHSKNTEQQPTPIHNTKKKKQTKDKRENKQQNEETVNYSEDNQQNKGQIKEINNDNDSFKKEYVEIMNMSKSKSRQSIQVHSKPSCMSIHFKDSLSAQPSKVEDLRIKMAYSLMSNEGCSRRKQTLLRNEKYNEFMDALKQQRLKKFNNLFRVYKWKPAIIFLLISAVVFCLLGIYVLVESLYVVEINIDYKINDKEILFTVDREMPAPVYVYYKISNFYANFKGFLADESTNIIRESKCQYIKTVEDVYNYRCIDGKQTLPEINKDLVKNKGKSTVITGNGDEGATDNQGIIEGDSSNLTCERKSVDDNNNNHNVFPCGLVASSLFNDIIKIKKGSKYYNIDTISVSNKFDFFTYSLKKENLSKYLKVWYLSNSVPYRTWSRSPMTSSFIKTYGVIHEKLESGKDYKLVFTQNTWPAEKWNAKKAITIVSLGNIGTSSFSLAFVFFAMALFYLLVSLIIFLLIKMKYYKLGISFLYCKINTEEVTPGQQALFRSITDQNMKDIQISNKDKENNNDDDNNRDTDNKDNNVDINEESSVIFNENDQTYQKKITQTKDNKLENRKERNTKKKSINVNNSEKNI